MYLFSTLSLSIIASLDIFSKKKRYKSLLWFICFFLLIFHDGFRWEIGTDWQPYYTFFQTCTDIVKSDYDIGYTLFNQFVRLFTDSYSVFLILFAIIQYIFVFESISKYSVAPFLSLFLYYCLSLPVLGMNRQFIALCLCLFAIRYIVSREIVKFLMCLLVAFTFHKSVVIFAPAYFLCKSYPLKYYGLLLFLVIGISLSGIINKLPLEYFALLGQDSADRMDFYADSFLKGDVSTSLVGSILAILKRSIWILLLLFFSKYIKKNEYYAIAFNLYYIALLFYILFNNTIMQIIVGRGLIYFNIMEIFIVPFVLTMFKNNWGKLILFFLIVFYGYTNLVKGINYYPEVFIPYKNIF
ncbi:EpsG family protein [Bacteroides sp.]|uniref:EpsG family protein n=1 Tax=Bacteroides sp. TaxID=29523 RepID=UPI003528B7B4